MRMSRKTVKQRSIVHTTTKAGSHEAAGIALEPKQQEPRDLIEAEPQGEGTEAATLAPKPPIRHKYERQWDRHKVQHPEKYYEGWESDECPLEVHGTSLASEVVSHHTAQRSREVSSGFSTSSTSGLSSPNSTGIESPKSASASFSARKRISLFRSRVSSTSASTSSLPSRLYSPKLRKFAEAETQSSPSAPQSTQQRRAVVQKRTVEVQPVVVLTKIESIELDSSSGDEAEQALQHLRSVRSPRASLLSAAWSHSASPPQEASSSRYLMQTAEVLACTKSLVKRRTETFHIPQRLFKHV